MAGLAAAQRARELGHQVDVYERNDYIGGHAHSHETDGFTFDEGPHVSFTKRPEIISLFAETVNGEFLDHDAVVTNYWAGHWVVHPAQCNLHGLPVDIVEKCILDLAEAKYAPDPPLANYADWCLASLGRTFSEQFTFRYTRKYWTTEAGNMSTDMLPTTSGSKRVYSPQLEEMVRGALSPNQEKFHYVTHFRYPLKGGFRSYVPSVGAGQEVEFGHDLVAVDLKRSELEFANGKKKNFETLISSLPLPELIRRIKDAPKIVKEAAERLVCTSLVVVNVGVRRDEDFPEGAWMYFYDEDIIFARANFPHRYSPNNVPKGCGSVQIEVYHSRYTPLSCKDVLSRAIEDMIKAGLIRKGDEIMVAHERRIPYGNVLFDLNRAPNLKLVQTYLEENGVLCCGRYGRWDYSWTDDSIISGWKAAEAVGVTPKGG